MVVVLEVFRTPLDGVLITLTIFMSLGLQCKIWLASIVVSCDLLFRIVL